MDIRRQRRILMSVHCRKTTQKETRGKRRSFHFLLWCSGLCPLTCFSLVFVASVLYLLPASATPPLLVRLCTQPAELWILKVLGKNQCKSRQKSVADTHTKKASNAWAETKTWKRKSRSQRPYRQKRLSRKSETDSYCWHRLYVLLCSCIPLPVRIEWLEHTIFPCLHAEILIMIK